MVTLALFTRRSRLFGIPVWAAISASYLEAWEPPLGVERVVICGDNDKAADPTVGRTRRSAADRRRRRSSSAVWSWDLQARGDATASQ
jgi:hypothetical protein